MVSAKPEQILSLAFLLCAIFIPGAIKPFVDTFAYGTSYARVYGAAAFALALAFYQPSLLFLAELAKGRKKGLGKFSKIIHSLKSGIGCGWLVFAIAATFAFGLLGQYLFLKEIGGDRNVKYYIFDQRGYTSTHINHIHALKTLFCPFIPSDDIDCARPMLNYLPGFYPYIGLALFLASCIFAVMCYPNMKTASHKLAYFLLAFSSIKTSVDGGIFNFENLAFFMLVPFLLATKNRLAWTILGVAAWVPISHSLYEYYEPHQLALPFLAFFYSTTIVAMSPKLLFPLLLVSFFSPSYLVTKSEVVKDRWMPEACSNANAKPDYKMEVLAALQSECYATKEFGCGMVEAFGSYAIYRGQSVEKPELMLAKGLASNCTHGAFEIKAVRSEFKVLGIGRWDA
ncbi:MAG: hypothetical protein N3F07_02475 [Candidatus Micrarchaeota archaeon]|nr:hypothetical protein [Candidatus Micrarchaeota archaeon]